MEPAGAADRGLDSETWDRLARSGFTLLGIDEQHGGSGGTLRDLAAVVYEAAYACAALPVVETAWLAGPWLTLLDTDPGPGPATAAVAPGVRVDDGGTATGTVRHVPALRWSRSVALLTGGEQPRLALVDPSGSGVRAEERANLAGEPRDTLVLHDAPVHWVAADAGEADQHRLRGALARSVQLAAAAQRVLDRTLAHVRERHQFGRPVSAFQAVQHRLAAIAGDVVVMHAAVEAAVAGWADRADDADFLVAVAKAETSWRAGRVASAGHQLHGAIGFTLEHDLGAATKRLWSWREEFGNEGAWRPHVAAAVGEHLWEVVTR